MVDERDALGRLVGEFERRPNQGSTDAPTMLVRRRTALVAICFATLTCLAAAVAFVVETPQTTTPTPLADDPVKFPPARTIHFDVVRAHLIDAHTVMVITSEGKASETLEIQSWKISKHRVWDNSSDFKVSAVPGSIRIIADVSRGRSAWIKYNLQRYMVFVGWTSNKMVERMEDVELHVHEASDVW